MAQEHDSYLRLAAEYDNYRKRSQKEKESLYTDIRSETVEKFLPVYDNLERALAQETQNPGAFLTREYGCNAMVIDREPADAQTESALAAAALYEDVILAVSGSGCAALAERLAETGVRVTVAVMDSPYAAESYRETGAAAVIFSYENTDYSIRAAAELLMDGGAVSE